MSRRLGRYELETRLATSATSEVWVAREADAGILATKLAVKLLWSELAADPGFLEHFLAEAKRAAQLRHPNIVQIRDLAAEGGEYFTVMELVPGESLRDVVTQLRAERQRMPVGVALRLAADAARALHAAHAATDGLGQPLHILHKGLRPSNLLLGYDGRVKLTDFGTASVLLLPQLVALKSRVHPLKYAYLSPEQCLHTPLDARSDIFALGVILWELLAGRRLFDQADEFAVKQAVMAAVAPPPSRLRADVPAEVDAAVGRALQRNPAARFSTAAELGDALERAMGALPHRAEAAHVGRFLADIFPDRRARWRALVSGEGAPTESGPASGTLLRGATQRPPSTRTPTRPRQGVASPPPTWADRTVDEPAPPRRGGATAAPPPATAAPSAPESPAVPSWGAGPSEEPGALDVGATLLTPTEIPEDALAAPGASPSTTGLVVPEPGRGAEAPVDDATMEDAAAAAGLDLPGVEEHADPAGMAGGRTAPAGAAGPILPGPVPQPEAARPAAPEPRPSSGGAPFEETLDAPPPSRTAGPGHAQGPVGAEGPAPAWNGQPLRPDAPERAPRDEQEAPLGVSPPQGEGAPSRPSKGAPTGPPPDGFQPDIFAEDPTPEGPWAPDFRLEESLAPPPPPPKDAKLGPLTASVLREHGETLVGDASVRAGGRPFTAVDGKLVVRIRGRRAERCEVRVPPEYAGEVTRADGSREAVAGGSTLLLGDGDLARLAAGEDRFLIRVLRPPAEPRGWDLAIPVRVLAVALALSLVMHVVLAVSVGVLQESGVIIPVEKPAPAEKFAQARVRKVKSLKPHKKKKPKPKRRIVRKKSPKRVAKRKKVPKITEKPPDPSDAPAKVPNAVRKRLSKAMKNRYAGKSRKERVKAIFKTPHAGSATTFKQAVSNVRSVAAKGASSAFRIAGSETHLPGGGVNLAVGGGGEQGPVTKGADAVGGSVKKLAARAKPGGGKVRGRVRGLRAAARVTGTLSRSEVLKVIGRHTRAIQRCYEKELMSKPGLSGKITFAWSITPTGRVSGARQRTSTMGSSKVSNCILKVIRRMKFPKPKGGSVTIVYPFIFRSSS